MPASATPAGRAPTAPPPTPSPPAAPPTAPATASACRSRGRGRRPPPRRAPRRRASAAPTRASSPAWRRRTRAARRCRSACASRGGARSTARCRCAPPTAAATATASRDVVARRRREGDDCATASVACPTAAAIIWRAPRHGVFSQHDQRRPVQLRVRRRPGCLEHARHDLLRALRRRPAVPGRGTCYRGRCGCDEGYAGIACQKRVCDNGCSGRGVATVEAANLRGRLGRRRRQRPRDVAGCVHRLRAERKCLSARRVGRRALRRARGARALCGGRAGRCAKGTTTRLRVGEGTGRSPAWRLCSPRGVARASGRCAVGHHRACAAGVEAPPRPARRARRRRQAEQPCAASPPARARASRPWTSSDGAERTRVAPQRRPEAAAGRL